MINQLSKNNAAREAVLEGSRVFILGSIPASVLILGIITSGINSQTGEIAINYSVVFATFLTQFFTLLSTALVRALDKYKHLENKQIDPDFSSLKKGIVNF